MSGKFTSYGLKAAQIAEKSSFFSRRKWFRAGAPEGPVEPWSLGGLWEHTIT